jgi:hypothetical protein
MTWCSTFTRGGSLEGDGAIRTRLDMPHNYVEWEERWAAEAWEGVRREVFAYDVAASRRRGDPIASCVTWHLVKDKMKGSPVLVTQRS